MHSTIPLQAAGVASIMLLLFVVSLLLVFWVYSDAKQNSEHPAFLWAVVVFLAPLLGLVLYFLVGWNRTYSRPPGSGSRKSPSRRRPPR